MTKRICCFVFAIWLMVSSFAVVGSAAASETDNFIGGYQLTGDGGADLVAIAMAQEGRTGKDFGYDDQWCAYFISDCARIAGETGAIPPHGTCTYLYQNILNAGGQVTTHDPRPGDICFINWSGESRMRHVEIVYHVENGKVYTIGGNSGSESHYSTRRVKRHDPIDPGCILAIVRPNYGVEAALSQPAPSKPAPAPKPVTYQIWFDASDSLNVPKTQTITKGKSMCLAQEVPIRPGYIFLGWRCSDGNVYAPGSTFQRDADSLLVAQWQAQHDFCSQLRRLAPRPMDGKAARVQLAEGIRLDQFYQVLLYEG